MLLALMFTFGLLAPSTSEVQKPAAVSIYVGPQIRDGFIDGDRGVLDSIDDVVRELRKDKRLRIVSRADEATLRLEILSRAVAGSAGAVAMPMGAGAIAVPIPGHTLNAVLKFSEYEKPMLVNDQEYGTWRRLAVLLARDVRAWVDSNIAKLQ